MKRAVDPVAIAQQLLRALEQQPVANEDEGEPVIDEAALTERARAAADRIRRARNR